MNHIELSLPDWVPSFLEKHPSILKTPEERMKFVLALTQMNVESKTGGPFGAAVFELETGKLVSVGVNQVVAETCSSAHAEVMALSFAQKKIAQFDLGSEGLPTHQLVSSAQMCAMCLGAVCWSGVREVIYAASGEDVEGIVGFDEGPVPEEYDESLEKRGIRVISQFMRKEGRKVLELYVKLGGVVYNSRQG